MKESKKHNTPSNSSGNGNLPLHGFFLALKRNDFTISPEQIEQAYLVTGQFAGEVKYESELCEYLSPIFAKSEDEQTQFKAIFEHFFIQNEDISIKSTPPLWRRRWFLAGFIGLVFIFFALYTLRCHIGLGCDQPMVALISIISSDDEIGRDLELQFQYQDSLESPTFETKTDWGDGTPIDRKLRHKYTKDSIYLISANVEFKNDWGFFYADTTITKSIKICIPAEIKVKKSFEQNSILVGDMFELIATINGKEPDSVRWSGDNLSTLLNVTSKEAKVVINEEGERDFVFTAYYGAKNDFCNIIKKIRIFADEDIKTPLSSIEATANALPIELDKEFLPWIYLLGIFIFIGIVFLGLYLAQFFEKKKVKENSKLENRERYDEMIRSFSQGKTGSLEIPFLKKDYLPIIEAGIEDVAKDMRKRVDDDISYLNIEKTISKTVHNVGFFEPVYTSRTQQSEFLVLVHQKKSNDQQAKLFDFLINQLSRQGVYIEKYYFNNTLLKCHNDAMKVTLEKLSAQYPEHILLVYGDAYQLIHQEYPTINRNVLGILNNWEHKAIITPISYIDWGYNEKQLFLKEIPIFPVDVQGQLLLMKKLFDENVDIPTILNQSRNNFYNHMMLDFEDVTELVGYCGSFDRAQDNREQPYEDIFFQWVAALAVYPKIRWDLSLAIGKALFEKNGLLQKFNFTALLQLARITWIAEGKFPDSIRLELLTRLSSENELLARETVLQVLDEIPETELNKNHFAYEEKETQRIINEFTLYAFDSEKYNGYSVSRELFEELRNENVITDSVAKSYLENSDMKWETLIHGANEKNTSKRTKVTLDDYFNKESKEQIYGMRFWTKETFPIILYSLLFLLFIGNFVNLPLSAMRDAATEKYVQINYLSNADSLTQKLELKIGRETIDLLKTPQSGNLMSEERGNTLPVKLLLDGREKPVQLIWNNKELIDSMMVIAYDTYAVNLSAVVPIDPDELDLDNDGIIGKEDLCPNEFGTVENNGCPDSDGDGVLDIDDECPDEPGLQSYNGCPQPSSRDRDGDGIDDKEDECPGKAGPREFNGCPRDDLNSYKIGFYFYPEQREIAEKIERYLRGRGFTGSTQFYPSTAAFFKNSDPASGYEIRFDKGFELNTARSLKNILDSYSEYFNFTVRNVGTPTPGFMSVFIPVDSDGDGILDKNDDCPNEQGTLSNGCNQPEINYSRGDSDGDGILDKDDACPKERGTIANNGCPEVTETEQQRFIDSDGDGISDANDACINLKGSEKNNGCPSRITRRDSDGDGIPNTDDACPDIAGLKTFNGCPDTDGDGIPDKDDACPTEPGTSFSNGCPETDGDGVPDRDDACPNEAGPAENNGCPWPDKDGDGVLDKDDKCPDVAGTVANTGCPEVTEELLKQLNAYAKTIQFDTGKSSLKPYTSKVLRDIVAILNEYPETKFRIECHTDNLGNASTNQKLSESRANAVRDFLIANGIRSDRLTAIGYGEDRPIASNENRSGRAQNRRIEINLVK